ncbi:MAG: 5-formyltetrahydrofolate cyclo-ligase [Burkholderiales bacterium]|nr:5-formyltetrahydrofolate cyclo-ligase [Burkholderiales bacterium]
MTVLPSSAYSVREYKTALRTHMLAARDRLPPEIRARASAVIAQKILGLPSFVRARTVLIFYPYGSEWDATHIIRSALARKKKLILPRRVKENKTLDLYAVTDLDRETEWVDKIREPLTSLPKVAPEEVDWFLVPGVAFSLLGDRLGHGLGYFDKLLDAASPTAFIAAGAFDIQIVDSLQTEPHDKKVQFVGVGSTY